MIIKKLYIQNFRNIDLLDICPDPEVNLIYGSNGSGKTSFLEAISYLSLGRSFRTSNIHHLIRDNHDSFILSTTIRDDDKDQDDTLAISRSRNRAVNLQIKINHQPTHTLLELIDHICVQIIHPQGTELVTGSPDERRAFLDWGLYYAYPEFKNCWINYKKILSQRNALLKQKSSPQQIAIWDDLFAELAEKISAMRENYLQQLLPQLNVTL